MPFDYSKLRAAIIAAVPDIVKLRPGCYFKWSSDKEDKDGNNIIENFRVVTIHGYEDLLGGRHGWSMYAIEEGKTELISFDNPSDYERGEDFFTYATVIGRPITLADVLRAIKSPDEDSMWVVTNEGKFVQMCWHQADCGCCSEQLAEGGALWNLALDFDGQSDETKKFLYSIIYPKI